MAAFVTASGTQFDSNINIHIFTATAASSATATSTPTHLGSGKGGKGIVHQQRLAVLAQHHVVQLLLLVAAAHGDRTEALRLAPLVQAASVHHLQGAPMHQN